ncbi:CGNR zinc finger domain-containing protein [Sphingomonas morindae]|uniref:CGNR zinc finger domain-containing protein n=1 Tax=Sphingomonas morindae TaxID=1541170 RepID=A0ABY4XE55_9SPHN|nr:ABATE domain-containing protein [Sphingomonas morindae]USI75139.1 CGNR zinc finger domain-containing protein [Sphingomonas morindae]
MSDAHEDAARPEERDGFRFRGGRNAIDLPATLQARLQPAPRELLTCPEDLSRWLVAAEMADTQPASGESDLATAHRLREAIYALANSLHGLPGDASAARDTLNEIAAQPAANPILLPNGRVRLDGTTANLLATLARDAVHMFGGDESARIKQCQSSTCTLYFVDDSRKGDRRWCSMSACGNKAKVQKFRARSKATSGDREAKRASAVDDGT